MDDPQTLDLFTPDNGDDAAPIERHAAQAYLGYAVSTVKARALPEIADGLKPVQRRILYAMGDTGAAGFAKCARYVGEVLGKYHPHGDSSTYEALVHLAQPFSMRYPLIDGQGNFGSRDGDAAAAYRYTEARLSRYAELMLAEIGEGTVDFVKNYDGKFEEPALAPLANPKPSFDKKEVTHEQKRLKQFILDQVEGARDESDRKSKLRLVIEPRSSRQVPEEMMAALLVHTSLESRYALNLTWLGRDGLPETKGIVEALRGWGEFRVATARRRTQFRLDRVQQRIEIVLGRLLAYAKIDEIIKLIRASEDQAEARLNLQKKYKFTDKQAEDIVNLRLGQLTKLDGIKLNDERKALESERKELKSLLGDDKELKKLVVKELADDSKKYGDERRTLIKTAERAQIERTVVE